jgi:AcrR family transcriptional regulator
MGAKAGLDHATVVQVAAQLADSKGLEEVSLAALAAQLGVRSPTLYHYVEGLSGLRHDLALLGTRELAQWLGRSVMGNAGEEAILALATAYRAFVKEHTGRYTATMRAADPEDPELQLAQQEIVEIGLRALAAYHLQRDEAIHAIRIMRSMIHGFASLEIAGGFGIPLDVDETFRRLMRQFIDYLEQRKQ